jgi:RNA polymerase sigma-70 factor (ECF subfamily)
MVREHLRSVLAVCLAYTGCVHDAEELSQQTFLKAFARLDTLQDPSRLRGWLFQIARRLCINHHRKKRPSFPLPDEIADQVEPEDPRLERLHAALAALPREYREPMVLYYLDGRSCAKTAAELGISEAAVRTRLFRARLKLHDHLTRGRT